MLYYIKIASSELKTTCYYAIVEMQVSLISNNLEEVKINTAKLLKDKNMQNIMVENQTKVINRNSAKDLVDFVQKNLSQSIIKKLQ